MRPNTILMNFRLPISLKDNFDQICQIKNISMSTQLNLFIRDFVDNEIDILPTKEENKSIWFKDRYIDPDKTTKDNSRLFCKLIKEIISL